MNDNKMRVRGRFAPSPPGPLHFGSLVAATASYLSARAKGGDWLVRMEDLDPPREMKGAADDILRTLEVYGFEWDGTVMYQSRRSEAYEAALVKLQSDGRVYSCGCSRKEIADSSVRGIEGPVYPGTCRDGLAPGREPRAWRVRTDGAVIEFVDRIQGPQSCDLAAEVGDFVVKRADGHHAYQLAVVVDDAEQGVTEVVRGADLLHSSTRQSWLQQMLGLGRIEYAHVPAIVNLQGEKLSKQTGASPLPQSCRGATLIRALATLGVVIPDGGDPDDVSALWKEAMSLWNEARVPRQRSLDMPD